MQLPLVQGPNTETKSSAVIEYVHHHQERITSIIRASLPYTSPPAPPPLSKDQIACIKDPHLLHMIHLSWILRSFESMLRPIGWSPRTPHPDTSYYLTLSLLLKAIGQSTEAQLLAQKNNQKAITSIFADALQNYIPDNLVYPAEIYLLADAIVHPTEDHLWSLSLRPMPQTIEAASALLNKTQNVFKVLQQHDAEGYLTELDGFDEIWNQFIFQLIEEKEKNKVCWCGPFELNTRLHNLATARLYHKRRDKIMELAEQLRVDETNSDLLKVLTGEVQSLLNKKTLNIPTVQTGILSNRAAEAITAAAKNPLVKTALDAMVQKDEIIFFDMVLQLATLLLQKEELSEDAIGVVFKPLLSPIACVHQKLEHCSLELEEVRHILLKLVINSHLELAAPQEKTIKKALDTAFPTKKQLPPMEQVALDKELKGLLNHFSRAWRKELDGMIKQLIIDYRLVFLTKNMRLTVLAQEILELGLKIFDPVDLGAGYAREISFIDSKSI